MAFSGLDRSAYAVITFHCRELRRLLQAKAAPDGSSTYYALRRAPSARQPLLTAFYALRRELEDTVKETSDPTIGRTKHAWWQRNWPACLAANPRIR